MFNRTTKVSLLIIAVFMGGCGPTFDPSRGSDKISPLKEWKISDSSGGFANIGKAIDSDMMSAAVTPARYKGASFTLDLGRLCYFNMIVIIHGANEMGFARRVEVSTSADGRNFVHRNTLSGTRKYTYISLLTPVNARYVKFTAVEQGSRPWSIGGLYFQ